MFEFLEPEVTTAARLRVISRQNAEIQEEYINRIRIDDMELDKIKQLTRNIIFLSWDIKEESKFRIKMAQLLDLRRD